MATAETDQPRSVTVTDERPYTAPSPASGFDSWCGKLAYGRPGAGRTNDTRSQSTSGRARAAATTIPAREHTPMVVSRAPKNSQRTIRERRLAQRAQGKE